MGISLSREASDFDLELLATAHRIIGCAPASDYDLESPQTVTCSSYYGATEMWIWKKAVAIDIPEESLVDLRLASVVSIFRVPNFLKELKNRAYVPQIFSLGLYHSNEENLSRMDYKRRALRRMMTRFNNNRDLDSDNIEFSCRAIDQISQDQEKIINNYEETIYCHHNNLAVMLTLDGCFILEMLRTLGGNKVSREVSDNYEPIFERRKIDFTGFYMLKDILMLENQIPLIVLRKLLQLEFDSADHAEKFLFDLLVKAPGTKFYPFDYRDHMRKWSWSPLPPDEQPHHLLGLLHSLIVSPTSYDGGESADQIENNSKEKSGEDYRCIPPAVKLRNAGIKFGRRNGGIEKIYFDQKEDTIYLPPINITDYTEVLFRNLIALELCKPSGMNQVTCYVSLMNNLIATETDVVVLRNSGIVKNYLGSDKRVAELFNDLCKGVTLPRKDVFEKLQDDVMDYCRYKVKVKAKVKVWSAEFIKDYFSSPWKILALVGAILVLLLTLVQTIYSVLAYYK